jgi:hypothetical protein
MLAYTRKLCIVEDAQEFHYSYILLCVPLFDGLPYLHSTVPVESLIYLPQTLRYLVMFC